MGKIINLFELLDFEEELTSINPASRATKEKELLRQSILRQREELSDEEMDKAAGGAKPPDPEIK